MDVPRTTDLADELGVGGRLLDTIRTNLVALFRDVQWEGPDAKRFHTDFDRFADGMRREASALHAVAHELHRLIRTQREASGR